mgnify:CR=1 FL=1
MERSKIVRTTFSKADNFMNDNKKMLKLQFVYKRWQNSINNPWLITDATVNVEPYHWLIKEIENIKDWEIKKLENYKIKRYKNSIFVSSWTKSLYSMNIYEDVYNII